MLPVGCGVATPFGRSKNFRGANPLMVKSAVYEPALVEASSGSLLIRNTSHSSSLVPKVIFLLYIVSTKKTRKYFFRWLAGAIMTYLG